MPQVKHDYFLPFKPMALFGLVEYTGRGVPGSVENTGCRGFGDMAQPSKSTCNKIFPQLTFQFFLRQARWACVKRRSLCKHVAATTENRRKRQPRRQHRQWRGKQRRWWIHDQVENSFGERRRDHLVSPMMAHHKALLGLLRELIGDSFSKLSCNLVCTKRSHAPCYSIGIVRGWPTFLPAGYLSQ